MNRLGLVRLAVAVALLALDRPSRRLQISVRFDEAREAALGRVEELKD